VKSPEEMMEDAQFEKVLKLLFGMRLWLWVLTLCKWGNVLRIWVRPSLQLILYSNYVACAQNYKVVLSL
jgi:hypothetical protein